MKKCPSWLQNLLFGGSHFKPRKKLRKRTKTGPKRDPQAIEPDLAGERKAHVESDVTALLSAAISGIWCYNVAV